MIADAEAKGIIKPGEVSLCSNYIIKFFIMCYVSYFDSFQGNKFSITLYLDDKVKSYCLFLFVSEECIN